MAATAQTTVTFPILVDSLVSRFGDATALVFGDESISFWELADRSMRLSQGLRDLGIRRRDVAAIWFRNDPNWPVAFLACARVGANAIALNTRFHQAELNDVFERLAPRAPTVQKCSAVHCALWRRNFWTNNRFVLTLKVFQSRP